MLEISLLNFGFFYLLFSSNQDFYNSVSGALANVQDGLVLPAGGVLLLAFTFFGIMSHKTSFKSSRMLKTFLFFTFFFAAVRATGLLETTVNLEFMNIAMLLYFVQSLPGTRDIGSASKAATLKAYKTANSRYSLAAVATLFFTMFFIAIFFFTFFTITLFFLGGDPTYEAFALHSKFTLNTPSVFFFFITLAIKVGGAPLHLWKLEVFNSMGLPYILYYSLVYLFFFFSILYAVFVKLDLSLCSEVYFFIFTVLTLNFIFIILNTYAVTEIRHFIVLSTLLNSSLFLVSILLLNELDLSFYFLFFFNYSISSFLFFLFLSTGSPGLRFLSDVKSRENLAGNLLTFLLPLVSLSGAAPLFGFLIKLSLLISLVASNYLIFFALATLSIIFTLVFYFQLFKNFFKPADRSFSQATASGSSYLIGAFGVLLALLPGLVLLVSFVFGVNVPFSGL